MTVHAVGGAPLVRLEPVRTWHHQGLIAVALPPQSEASFVCRRASSPVARRPSPVAMSTIQNLKNFIRHGKQARAANPAFADPTTTVSPVQVQQHHGRHQQHAISDPPMTHHQPPAAAPRGADLTVPGNVDHRNVAAQGAAAAAKATADQQRLPEAHGENRSKAYDQALLERMVAEERESKGKFPAYPGLDRWTLLEKMGDGAFSNVYRARDNRGQVDEVAIKVVRKFEMNSSQVRFHAWRPAVARPALYMLPFALTRPSVCYGGLVLSLRAAPVACSDLDREKSRPWPTSVGPI